MRAGTFGPELEKGLREHGVTLGHWPQSMDLSTVGGWIACRGAGQYSTRYGKIEDMVVGLKVVMADGTIITTGGTGPRAAVGPDLNQLFVGSEGTLGIVTEARLRIASRRSRRRPAARGGSQDFAEGLDACRRILRRGATPAVLRLYDTVESERNFGDGTHAVLIVLDEADPVILESTIAIVDLECEASGAEPLDRISSSAGCGTATTSPRSRPSTAQGSSSTRSRSPPGGPYSRISTTPASAALEAVEGTLVASAHQSHSYTDGACIYMTFAGRMPESSETAQDPRRMRGRSAITRLPGKR